MFLANIKSRIQQLSREGWTFFFLTAVSVFVLFRFVSLSPQVDNDFFFSSDDPHFQADIEIGKLFDRKDSQIIISAAGNIHSSEYQNKVEYFTELLMTLEDVHGVISVSHGPEDTADAIKSPLWKRLLVSDDQKSTNLIVLIDEAKAQAVTPKIENLIHALQADDFEINMSGFPYIVELIRRYLVRDINVFSSLAFILLGFLVVLIFHSWRILIGTLITCMNACIITLMILNLFGFKIGLLTANIVTIIFVLTLSHLIFLTFNWRHIQENDLKGKSATVEAIEMTFQASFWSMVTTLMGFVSLLFVQAKPLRELGVSGVIGSIMAITAAYCIYPVFIRPIKTPKAEYDKQVKEYYKKIYKLFKKHTSLVIILLTCLIIVSLPNIKTLNTDPSLISFFAKGSEIAEGLKYIDKNGGSSPLVLVLEDKDGQTLNSEKIYKRLWSLQEHLENHHSVGAIISLPVLMAESKRNPFTFFFAWEWLLDILESPEYDEIAKSFITADRKYGLFLLRMKEEGRIEHRLKIIKQIKKIVYAHDFKPTLMGGVFALHGQLSKLIASSLIWGLGRLLILFFIIAYIVSRSIRISMAMTFSISIIPLCIFGMFGILNVPLDLIAAPAANIAIAIGIDAMIHMVQAYRRLKVRMSNESKIWAKVISQLWEPITTSAIIVGTGFAIFFCSSFPPTQRFGGAIVFGTFIAAICALFVFPLIAQLNFKVTSRFFKEEMKDLSPKL